MSRLERDLRTMLHRRAADIDGAATAPPTSSSARPSRVAAAAAALTIGGLATYALVGSDSPAEVSTDLVPTTTVVERPDDPTDPGEPAGGGDPTDRGEAPAAPTEWRALLPDGFVPETASTVFAVEATSIEDPVTSTEAAIRYLEDRAPVLARTSADQPLVATLVEDGAVLDVIHLASGHDDQWTETVVVVRSYEQFRHEIVASLDAGLDVTSIRRTASGIEGSVLNPRLDGLAADVLSLDGEVLETSPNPAGVTGESPIFGTAGWEEGRLPDGSARALDIDVPVDDSVVAPVIVMLRHIGGAELSITEFALRPSSIGGLCTADQQPDIAIGVGEWFGPLGDGAAPGSLWAQIEGQLRRYAEGDFGSIEVLWPISPEWLEFPVPANAGDSRSAERHFPGIGDVIIGSGADPCGWVQVSFTGDPLVVERFATAVAGMYQFTETVDLASIDLSDIIDPQSAGGTDEPEGRVIGLVTVDVLPTIPETGSCDGLPEAPPQRGDGPAGFSATAEAALADWLAAQTLDPPAPLTGYVELIIEGQLAAYAFQIEEQTFVLAVVESTSDGWRVVRWEASAC